MKRFPWLLATITVIALAGCGGGSNGDDVINDNGTDVMPVDEGNPGEDTNVPHDTVEPQDTTAPEDTLAPEDVAEGGLTPPDLRTTYMYRMHTGAPGEYKDFPGLLQEETVEYDGETWYRGQVGNFTADAGEGLTVYVAPALDEEMGVGLAFKACEVYNGQKEPQFWYSFTPAIKAWANVPVGDKQTVTASGVLGFSVDEPMSMEATVEYTLVSKNASVEVPYGTVDGCYLYSVDAWEAMGEEEPYGPMHVDVYVKPDFGIVRISMVPGYDAMELVSVTFP